MKFDKLNPVLNANEIIHKTWSDRWSSLKNQPNLLSAPRNHS